MKAKFKIDTVYPLSIRLIGWLESISLLKLLYELLTSYSLITISYKDFCKHFVIDSLITEYIYWYGDATQLVYLFDLLMIYKCIPNHDGRRHKLITEHFCNNKGNSYKPKNLGVALNQIRNESPGIIEINEIFQKLIEGGLKSINHQA